jgi:hypothetical protein
MEDEKNLYRSKTSNDATTFGQMTLGQMAIGRTSLGIHFSAPGRVYGRHLYLLN